MRIKRLEISPEVIARMGNGKFEVVRDGNELPADAKIIRAGYDYLTDVFFVIVESCEYPDTPDGCPAPVARSFTVTRTVVS